MQYTHNHDVIHVINQAAMGSAWAYSLIDQAYQAVFDDYDQTPGMCSLSIHDQELIDTINKGLNLIANKEY